MNPITLALVAMLGGANLSHGFSVSGTVTDRVGNAVSGVNVTLVHTGLSATSDSQGAWLVSGVASTSPRSSPAHSFHWTGHSICLTLSVPSAVRLELFDLRGASLGRFAHARLDVGSHDLPFRVTSTGASWLRVTVNGTTETVLVGPYLGFGIEPGSDQSMSNDQPLPQRPVLAARSQTVVDTLRFTRNSRVIAMVPVVNLDTSGIVVVIGADSSIAWNDTILYGSLYDNRDGQVYRTVTIGNQNWMAENLNFKVDSSWCTLDPYKSDLRNCDLYGRLYQWTAAMALDPKYNSMGWAGNTLSRRGICPVGWHVPQDSEWQDLLTIVDSDPRVPRFHGGAALMSKDGWSAPIDSVIGPDSLGFGVYSGTDLFGFRILPAGDRYWDGRFFERQGNRASFWTSSECGATDACFWVQQLGYGYMGANRYYKSHGFSLRCIQD
ncbi:MAG TPA: FISUMP domain-containing protein [Fibrobacteria bacterium]|nr:FISUMP domain-containing protein [Fibrobacteria bacterium]